MTNRQLQILIERLRFCTGFSELKFDQTGQLDLGDRTRVSGGSIEARQLVTAAVDSADSFFLESRYHSPAVAFAQIADTDEYVDGSGKSHRVWQIRLDFFDFTTLRGDRLTLATFDPALNFLHELIHGVLKEQDPLDDSDPLGDCERRLNLIRAQLQLPERLTYLPRQRLAATGDNLAQVIQAEFIFVQKNPRTGKQKDLYLSFDLEKVCDPRRSKALSAYFR